MPTKNDQSGNIGITILGVTILVAILMGGLFYFSKFLPKNNSENLTKTSSSNLSSYLKKGQLSFTISPQKSMSLQSAFNSGGAIETTKENSFKIVGATDLSGETNLEGTVNINGNLAISGPTTIQSTLQATTIQAKDINLSDLLPSKTVFTDANKNLTSSGIVSITQGGTGLSAFGSGNQILGVNGAGTALEYKDLSSLIHVGNGLTISGTKSITLSLSQNTGTATTTNGSLVLTNNTNSNSTTLKSGVPQSNLTFTLPNSYGNSGNCLQSDGSGTLSFGICSTSPSRDWSGLTNPTANLSLAMSTDTTSFNWATGTGSNNLFSLSTDASSNGTGSLLSLQTGTSSTVIPLRVRAGSTEGLSVLANGNVGIGNTTGSEKLDITGNEVISGHLAIGGATIDPNILMNINTTLSSPTQLMAYKTNITNSTNQNLYGQSFYLNSTANGGTNAWLEGTYNELNNNGTATITNAYAYENGIYNNDTGTITNAYNLFGFIDNSSTGTITNAFGTHSELENTSTGTITTGRLFDGKMTNTGGTIGTLTGLNLSGWTNSGIVTNSYGIYLDNSTNVGSTKSFALYSTSQAPSYLGGTSLILGPGEGGTPVSTTIRGAAGGGSDIVGANIVFDASNGTGNGGSGSFIFRTASAASGTSIVAADSNSNAAGTGSNTVSWSHTVTSSGSNRLLVVTVHMWTGTGTTVTGITYNGVSFDNTKKVVADQGTARTEIWYLPNPSTGANTVTVTLSDSPDSWVVGASSWLNVNQATPINGSNTNTGSGTTAAVTVTGGSLSSKVVDAVTGFCSTATQAGGQTLLYANTPCNVEGGSSYAGGGASVDMSWTVTNERWSIAAISLAPSVSPTTADALTERLSIDKDGNVLIGGGSLCVKSTFASCAGSTAGTIYASNTTVQSADLAENYISSTNLEPGTLVAPANDGNNMAVVKTSKAYQTKMLGVISTAPGVTLNSEAKVDATHPYLKPLALAGRVPVKVSTENGPIEVGDYLTSSTIPGVAMKALHAGPTIGKALEHYSGSGVGVILGFINPSFADPSSPYNNLVIDQNGQLVSVNDGLTDLSKTVNTLASTEDSTLSLTQSNSDILSTPQTIDSLLTGGLEIKTADLLNNLQTEVASLSAILVKVQNTSQENVSAINKIDNLFGINTVTGDSTASATIAKLSSEQLDANTLSVTGVFKSLGQNYLNNVEISGDLSIDGTLTMSGYSISSINTLYLQNGSLAQNIDIFNGKVKISKDGVLCLQRLEVAAQTLGTATIKAGDTSVTVSNAQINSRSKVFLSPHQPIAIGIINKNITNDAFTIGIDKAQDQDVTFDWWIVDSMTDQK